MINAISTILVQSDLFFERIPLISFAVNMTDLFLKHVFIPFLSDKTITSNKYLSYLDAKENWECVVLSIPGLGLLISDEQRSHRNNINVVKYKSQILEFIKKDSIAPRRNAHSDLNYIDVGFINTHVLSSPYMRDPDIAFAVVKKYGYLLANASKTLRNNSEIVKAAIQNSVGAFQFASNNLQQDSEIISLHNELHPYKKI